MAKTDQQMADDVHARVRSTVEQLARHGVTPGQERAEGYLNIAPLRAEQFPHALQPQARRLIMWASEHCHPADEVEEERFVAELLDLYERIVLVRGPIDV